MTQRSVDLIRSLVCGFPSRLRGSRTLMILQACIDDSATNARKSGKIYLLAGLIASVDEWSALSDEWDAALLEPPALSYFKLSQALSMKDEFDRSRGWTEELRNGRVARLAKITRTHVKAGYTVIVQKDAYDEFVGAYSHKYPDLKDPYHFCFFQIIDAVTKSRSWLGYSSGLDYVFDEHGLVGSRALDYWKALKLKMPWESPDDLGSSPAFRDEKKFAPLQAADLWAGLVRGVEEEMLTPGRMGIRQPWLDVFSGMKVNERKYSRDHLMELGADVLLKSAFRRGTGNYILDGTISHVQ